MSFNLANASFAILSWIFLGGGQMRNGLWHYLLIYVAFPLLLALLPAIFGRRWAVWVSSFPLGVGLFVLGGMLLMPETFRDWLGTELVVGMAGAICSSLALVAIDRKVLRWAARRGSVASASVAGALNALLIVAVLGGSIVWVVDSNNVPGQLSHGRVVWYVFALAWMSLGNLWPAMIAFGVLALVVVLTTHRLVWPMLHRPTYAVARLVRTPMALVPLGLSLIGFGLANPTWFARAREFFGLK